MLRILLEEFLGDLKAQRTRAILTFLAVAWGALAIVLLLAFGEGLKRSLRDGLLGAADERRRVASPWARANRSPQLRTTVRNGCGIAVTMPRSGQVPTTTSAPAVRSRRTAEDRWRTERVAGIRCVTSFAPIMITQTSGIRSGSATVSAT